MAANDFQYAREPVFTGEIAVKNTTGSGTLLAAGTTVKIDTSNLLSGTQYSPGVIAVTDDDAALGVLIENIADGKVGRCAVAGVAQAICSAAITAGAFVQASSTGKVKTNAGAKKTLGMALTSTGASGDMLLVLISQAANA